MGQEPSEAQEPDKLGIPLPGGMPSLSGSWLWLEGDNTREVTKTFEERKKLCRWHDL